MYITNGNVLSIFIFQQTFQGGTDELIEHRIASHRTSIKCIVNKYWNNQRNEISIKPHEAAEICTWFKLYWGSVLNYRLNQKRLKYGK